jgi:hypothetical protein
VPVQPSFSDRHRPAGEPHGTGAIWLSRRVHGGQLVDQRVRRSRSLAATSEGGG